MQHAHIIAWFLLPYSFKDMDINHNLISKKIKSRALNILEQIAQVIFTTLVCLCPCILPFVAGIQNSQSL